MANPVWVLSVDLQTKTATFQTGMAEAAKAARGSFSDIKSGAADMGGRTSYSMMEARHSVMMLGEEFGVRLPRSLSMFIAGLGPIGPALEAAFPFLAIAGLATIFIEKLHSIREAGEKLTTDQMGFETAANNAFNSLNEKLLQAQIKADELSKNHLAALKHQLELIDQQSLNELQHSFLELAKSMEPVMKDLEGHWYTFGEGADGAKHALDDFRTHYEFLLSQSKAGEASGLLHGTLEQAKKTLAMMDQLTKSRTGDGQKGNYEQYEQAANYLKEMGVLSKATGDYTQKTYDAQLNLVSALQDQVTAEQRIAEIKKLERSNATGTANQAVKTDADKDAKARMEEEVKAERGYLENFKQYEADRVNATQSGSWQRVSALRQAMEDTREIYGEESAIFQDYARQESKAYAEASDRQLEEVGRAMDEESRMKAEAAREDSANLERAGEMQIAAQRQQMALERSARRVSLDQQLADDLQIADEEYAVNLQALAREVAALDKFGRDYQNRLKQLQDKEKQLVQQHEMDVTAIKEKAEIEQNQRTQAAYQQFADMTSRGLTQSIMGHETWARTILSLGDQVVSGMMENAIKSALLDDFDRERDAARAARKAFNAGMQLPFPANLVAAPVLAAGAFAAVMAFAGGTDAVPGVGRGDVVPAMLTPGEGVVPGGVMDGLRNVARNGGFEQGPRNHVNMHVHMHASALDAGGMDKVLTKHADTFQRHFESTLRKMNR